MGKYWGKYILILGVCACFLTELRSQSTQGEKTAAWAKDTLAVADQINLARRYFNSNPDSLAILADIILKMATDIDFERGMAAGYQLKGKVSTDRNDYETSIENYKEALKIWERRGELKGQAVALNNIGINLFYLDQYEACTEYYIRALRIQEEGNHLENVRSTCNNIALVFNLMGDMEKALYYSRRSLATAKERNDPFEIIVSASNIAGHFKTAEMPDSGLHYALMAYNMSEEIDLTEGVIRSGLNLSQTYLDLKQFDKAISYADKVLTSGTKNPIFLGPAHMVRANAMLDSGRPRDGLEDSRKALDYILEGQRMPQIIDAYKTSSEINEALGNYKTALELKDKYQHLQDSTFNLEKNKQIEELETQYETEKKEREILQLSQEAKMSEAQIRQKNTLLLALAAGFLLVLAAGYFYNRQRILKEKQKVLQAQQRLLRAQINPHFFFNILASLQTYLLTSTDKGKTALYMAKLAKLMRATLEQSMDDTVSLESEIETLGNYLDLQKVRFKDGFDYSIECADEIDPEELAIPPMLAQPFIENSLEHGLLHKDGGGKIMIRFENGADMLTLSITDNGIGREKAAALNLAKAEKHISRATGITQDRIFLLNRKYDTVSSMEIQDIRDANGLSAGTKVIVKLPRIEA